MDIVNYLGSANGILVNLATGFGGTVEGTDRLTGIEEVFGSSFDDEIKGDQFGNTLRGFSGADFIDGGQGNELLFGGSGGDEFRFEAKLPSRFSSGFDSGFDRIMDLGTGDRINLRDHHAAGTFDEIRSSASQFGTDTHLRLEDDIIVLEEVALNELSASMFIL